MDEVGMLTIPTFVTEKLRMSKLKIKVKVQPDATQSVVQADKTENTVQFHQSRLIWTTHSF